MGGVKAELVEVPGLGARTVREWAERLGVSPQVVRRRLALGWSPERAVSEPKRSTQRHREPALLSVPGKGARSVAGWAAEIGCTPQTIYARLSNRWPLARALTEPRWSWGGPRHKSAASSVA